MVASLVFCGLVLVLVGFFIYHWFDHDAMMSSLLSMHKIGSLKDIACIIQLLW